MNQIHSFFLATNTISSARGLCSPVFPFPPLRSSLLALYHRRQAVPAGHGCHHIIFFFYPTMAAATTTSSFPFDEGKHDFGELRPF